MSNEGRKYQEAIRANPNKWVKNCLGVNLWGKQREILDAVFKYKKVAVRSGNGVGKTFLAACITMAYLESHTPSYVVTTGSSWTNIKKALWPEIAKLHKYSKYELGGELLPKSTTWNRGLTWGAFGISTQEPDRFAGFRTNNGMLVIVDEASALDSEIMQAINGLCSGARAKILLIGNPLYPSGPFYDAFKSETWKTFHISTFDSPNVIQGTEIIPGMSGKEFIEDSRKEYGEGSAFWQARVLGEFPDDSNTALVPLYWVEEALKRSYAPVAVEKTLYMGADIARAGSDKTVLLVRDKKRVLLIKEYTNKDLMETTGLIRRLAIDMNIDPARVCVDDIGVGGGVVDRLIELDFACSAVNFASRAIDSDKFANTRAEAHWNLRKALDPKSEEPLAIPREYKALAHELTQPNIKHTSRGQILLEAKKDIKKRLGRSPDSLDALALTYAGEVGFTMFIPDEARDKRHIEDEVEEIDLTITDERRMQMMEDDSMWS